MYAVNAISGEVRWRNDDSGGLNKEINKGVSAQGSLAICDGELLLAGGNMLSIGRYDLETGKCLNAAPKHVVGRSANRGGNRGKDILVFDDRFVLQGGNALYSAEGADVNPGTFMVHRAHSNTKVSLQNLAFQGGLAPVWNEDVLIAPVWLKGMIACYDKGKVAAAFENADSPENKEPPMTNVTPLWEMKLPDGAYPLSLAVSQNAAIAVIRQAGNKSWSLVAGSLEDGKEMWSAPIAERPLPDGICIDESGRITVTLLDGGALFFGAP